MDVIDMVFVNKGSHRKKNHFQNLYEGSLQNTIVKTIIFLGKGDGLEYEIELVSRDLSRMFWSMTQNYLFDILGRSKASAFQTCYATTIWSS